MTLGGTKLTFVNTFFFFSLTSYLFPIDSMCCDELYQVNYKDEIVCQHTDMWICSNNFQFDLSSSNWIKLNVAKVEPRYQHTSVVSGKVIRRNVITI